MNHEHHEQMALFQWMSYKPELKIAFAIPNAAKRSLRLAAYMKAEGLKPGVPDIFIPIARQNYHGLFIEMKAVKRGRLSDYQREYHYRLHENGFKVAVCYGFDEAKKEIEEYMGY